MIINPLKVIYNDRSSVKKLIRVDDYLSKRGISKDAIEIVNQKTNIIDDFLERHGIDEDALKTVEGRKGVLLKHRLRSRTILLYILAAPMVVVPFWLMWALSPLNAKHYSEQMKLALLGVLGADVLGLCYVVTQDLFPSGSRNHSHINENLNSDEDLSEDESS